MTFARKCTYRKAKLEGLNTNYNERAMLRLKTQALNSQNYLFSHNCILFEHDCTSVMIILLNYFYCRHFIQQMDSILKMCSNLVLFLLII